MSIYPRKPIELELALQIVVHGAVEPAVQAAAEKLKLPVSVVEAVVADLEAA